jgi:hypothetical protein
MTHNIAQKFTYQIKRQQRKADVKYNQPLSPSKPAWLGDNNGVITKYNNIELPDGYVVVRDADGNLSTAYNQRVPLWPNLGITVGYDPNLNPTLFQVLGIRDYLTKNPAFAIPSHHKTHEWPGQDTVFVHSEQFLPALLFANQGLIVSVFPFYFKKNDGSHGFIDYQTIDLTPYVPALGAQAFTLLAGDDETIHVVAGSTAGSIALINLTSFGTNIDNTLHELWGIRLFAGQTVIKQTKTYTDVFDFRWGGLAGGGSGHTILDQNGTIMVQQSNLQFAGSGIFVTEDVLSQKIIVQHMDTQAIGLARWGGLAGEYVFNYPDLVASINSVEINGVTEDPLNYSLASSTLVLSTVLPFNATVTSSYQLEII